MGTQRKEDRRRAIRRYLSGESPAGICASMGYSRVWLYKWLKRSRAAGEEWWGNHGLFCGAQAIRWELEELGVQPRPSLRTIARILRAAS